jgi:DNA-binding transcriptional ArsR family regulator
MLSRTMPSTIEAQLLARLRRIAPPTSDRSARTLPNRRPMTQGMTASQPRPVLPGRPPGCAGPRAQPAPRTGRLIRRPVMMMSKQSGMVEVKPALQSNVRIMRILCNDTRIEILTCLGRAERSVGGIATQLELDLPTVSRALKKLRKAGLVCHRVVKKQHIYRLCDHVSVTINDWSVSIEVLTDNGRVAIETRQP